MDEEARLKVLEEEMTTIKDEFGQMLLEVRMVIMDAQSPIRIYDKKEAERKSAAQGQIQQGGNNHDDNGNGQET